MVAKRDNVVGQRVQPPAHGHNPLEIMTQQDYTQHSITPPPELVSQWAEMLVSRSDHDVFMMAAQWGADQELKACCEHLTHCFLWAPDYVQEVRDARRPKLPSRKEQALDVPDNCSNKLTPPPKNALTWLQELQQANQQYLS